jgi:uncharacterized protein (DUF2336 family)
MPPQQAKTARRDGTPVIDPPVDLLATGSKYERVRLAASAKTAPETLAWLATDDSVLVRSAVALNRAAPDRVNRALTADDDQRVRRVLARKLGAMLPSLSGEEHQVLAAQAWANLAILARDAVARVREAVADTLKEMPDAPHAIIMNLACDPSFNVSDPVLRLSPVLTQDDLLALIRLRPASHTVQSIAHRPALNEAVCDAIAASADDAAIRNMLKNRSAALREATLDRLVEQAAGHSDWHEPMIYRPELSVKTAQLLAEYMTERLLGILGTRIDLSPSIRTALRRRLDRLGAMSNRKPAETETESAGWRSEAALIEAIRAGDTRLVTMILAVSAGLTLEAVEHAARTRNPRAALALLWKGGFTMRTGAAIQALLFNLPPSALLRPTPSGGFPLSEPELQIAFALLGRQFS